MIVVGTPFFKNGGTNRKKTQRILPYALEVFQIGVRERNYVLFVFICYVFFAKQTGFI